MKLSLVIPTYNEKDNVEELIKSIDKEFKKNKMSGELIIVDDNSPDGTGKILDSLKKKYKFLKVIHRSGKLGLASAVIEGWKIASGDILGVMDADLSHPIEKVHELFNPINSLSVELTIGSRHVKGGAIEGWTKYRAFQSKVATILAKSFTNAKDPMSGFFMIKKDCIDLEKLNSKGFKILVEVLAKGKYKKIEEIPITFKNRKFGKSKANLKEIFLCQRNILDAVIYKNFKKN